MDDIQAIQSPMRTKKAKGTKGLNDPFQNIDFGDSEKQMLADLAGMPVYQVFLRLLEGEVEKAETDHFRKHKNREEFDRTGLEAVAMRIFLDRVQLTVEHYRQEYFEGLEEKQVLEEVNKISPEELMERSVRNL